MFVNKWESARRSPGRSTVGRPGSSRLSNIPGGKVRLQVVSSSSYNQMEMRSEGETPPIYTNQEVTLQATRRLTGRGCVTLLTDRLSFGRPVGCVSVGATPRVTREHFVTRPIGVPSPSLFCPSLLHLALHYSNMHSISTDIDALSNSDMQFYLFRIATPAATRRLQFLLRCLGGYAGKAKNCGYQNTIRMQSVVSIGAGLEVDAVSVLRSIPSNLDSTKHKGQAGKIAVVGGCREYTGAPYFSAISALKIGADLSHVFCTKDAAPVIKSYSPELIVHPILEESYSIRDEDKSSISAKVIAEVDKWMERFDCLVIGPGLGRDPFLLDCVSNIIKHARDCDVPMVIDGDGLFLVTNCLDLVRGYPLAVLTPNINEYKRLVQSVLNSEVNDENGTEQLKLLVNGYHFRRRTMPSPLAPSYCNLKMLKLSSIDIVQSLIGGVTILRKGKSDLISDAYMAPLRRCGGQGDILSGSVAVFLCWARQQAAAKGELVTNPTILGCIAGSVLLRNAAALAFKNKRRSTLTGDIIEYLGQSLEEICPVL
nr:ATP-dependent (S)-NAD(P)H-hydrate dehydratase [Ipomoea batatas]